MNESGLLFAVYAWLLLHVMGQKTYYVALLRDLRGGTADAEIPSSTNGT